MDIGFIGLGKMGMNMVTRLVRGGHFVVAFDTDPQKRAEAESVGAKAVHSLSALVRALKAPRSIWVMVPAGLVTGDVLTSLGALCSAGDVIVDGGNSNFRDSIQRAQDLLAGGIHLLDAGTSGGVWGLEKGYCLMVGGVKKAFEQVSPAFETLAPPLGCLHVGHSGSGHYAKMVHNAIEYGMMQAYGEGFAMLDAAKDTLGYMYNLESLGSLWQRGSVVRSWLLELLVRAFAEDPELDKIRGYVSDSGEGRWMAKEAVDAAIPTPVLTLALQMRFLSRMEDAFSAKVCAALRQQFGGHAVASADKKEGVLS